LPTQTPRAVAADVDVIKADRIVGDDAKVGTGVEKRRVDSVGQQANDSLAIGSFFAKFLIRRR
jgi:hypothetical protein